MRIYSDPTYSVQVNSSIPIADSVSRFYVEVSTQFVGNNIDVMSCEAARQAAHFDEVAYPNMKLPIMDDFCSIPMFDLKSEEVPVGANHMVRVSIRKFFFVGSETVYTQSVSV